MCVDKKYFKNTLPDMTRHFGVEIYLYNPNKPLSLFNYNKDKSWIRNRIH